MHRIKITVIVFVLASLIAPSPILAAKKKRKVIKRPAVCRSVIFSDATKGKRLYSKNVNMKVLPASTTKVMTALVVLEKLSLDQYVTVSSRAPGVQPSKINLVPGEKY